MKKSLLFVAAAAFLAAIPASAQYQVDPGMDQTMTNNPQIVDAFILDAASIAGLKRENVVVHEYLIDDQTRHWYWWAGWEGGDSSFPGVDFHMDGYISQKVTGTAGWSGGGMAVDSPGINLAHITNDTHFHAAFRSDNVPDAIALIILDGEKDCGSMPGKVTIGKQAYNDNGTMFPVVADFDRAGGDWIGVDIKFADLKKIWPQFNPNATGTWSGNAISILSGNIAGQDFSLDAAYLYTPSSEQGGVEGVAQDETPLMVTNNTINGAAGIELYNVAGQLVKSTRGTVLGIDDLNPGVYVVKNGNKTAKVRI